MSAPRAKTARAQALARLRELQLERDLILAAYPELRDTRTPRRPKSRTSARIYVTRRREITQ